MRQLFRDRIPDKRVLQLLTQTSKLRKELIRRKLFIEQYKGSRNVIDKSIFPNLLKMEIEPLMTLQKSSGLPKTKFIPSNVTELKIAGSHKVLLRKYNDWIHDNAISFILEDLSETVTDINYRNIVTELGVDSINVESSYLNDVVDEFVPQDSKLISVPSSKLERSLTTLKALQLHNHDYRIHIVLINLTKSPQIAKEVLQLLQSKQTSDINYDSLLQIAKESRPDAQNFTRKFLTELSYAEIFSVRQKELNGSSFLVFKKN